MKAIIKLAVAISELRTRISWEYTFASLHILISNFCYHLLIPFVNYYYYISFPQITRTRWKDFFKHFNTLIFPQRRYVPKMCWERKKWQFCFSFVLLKSESGCCLSAWWILQGETKCAKKRKRVGLKEENFLDNRETIQAFEKQKLPKL